MTQWQTLNAPPAMAGLYARAALRTRVGPQPQELPATGLRCVLAIDPLRLGAFRKVCGYDNDGLLPPTYPHVLAFGLQLALLTDPHFPFPLLGLVQLAERIRLLRPLGGVDRVSASVHVQNLHPHADGAVFTLVTRLDDALGPLWEAEADLLCRKAHVDGQWAPPPATTELPADEVTHWLADKDVGRQYAKVAGDYNPIHLSLPSARLFGFSQAIAPGMWSLARSLAALRGHLPSAGVQLRAQFLKPVQLPSEVVLNASVPAERGHFSLTGRDASLHLAGEWAPLG
ncbi:MaoC/PaaZ C-terminal domain-containing protein [Pseudomonas sp. NPDC007930]|uniref:MaoC/PaaZ C-terminal domain-containing protein n=1 Tax=Pseudomonas sp. NPDC007930 TaxID=3364417 RepID=UPI0036E88649